MRQHLYVAEIGQDPGEFEFGDFSFDDASLGLGDLGGDDLGLGGGGDFDFGPGDLYPGDAGPGYEFSGSSDFPTGDLVGSGFDPQPGQVVLDSDGYAIGHLADDGVSIIPLSKAGPVDAFPGEYALPGDTGSGPSGSWFDPFANVGKKFGAGILGSIPGIVTGVIAGQQVKVGGKTYTTTADGKIVATTGTGTGGGGGGGAGAGGGGGGGGSGGNKAAGLSPVMLGAIVLGLVLLARK